MSGAQKIIADALWRLDGIHVEPDGPNDYHRSNADELIRRLRSAGLLVEPGGTTSTEWAIRERGRYGVARDLDQAYGLAPFSADGKVFQRTVTSWPDGSEHRSPWREAPMSKAIAIKQQPASAMLNDQHEGSTP